MNIVLIGYRGCGKTTVGRLLADALAMRLVDTDQRVIRDCGSMSLKLIWQTLGESQFRRIEARVLRQLLDGDNQVLSLGGGAVIDPQGRQIVAQARRALRIYLQCDADELARRIAADASRADRPSTGTIANNLQRITEQLAVRQPIYLSVADRVVNVTRQSPAQVAQQIQQIARRPWT